MVHGLRVPINLFAICCCRAADQQVSVGRFRRWPNKSAPETSNVYRADRGRFRRPFRTRHSCRGSGEFHKRNNTFNYRNNNRENNRRKRKLSPSERDPFPDHSIYLATKRFPPAKDNTFCPTG